MPGQSWKPSIADGRNLPQWDRGNGKNFSNGGRDWNNWRRNQDWTPPKRVKAKEAWKAEYVEQLTSIRSTSQSVTEPTVPKQDGSAFGAEQKKTAGTKLKHAIALRATLTDGHSELAHLLDAQIKDAKSIARGGPPTAAAIEEAEEALAAARVKENRAKKHLAKAEENLEKVSAEARQCQEVVSELCAPRQSSQQQQQPADSFVYGTALNMANALSSLRAGAVFSEKGMVVVDPALLETLASHVQSMADAFPGQKASVDSTLSQMGFPSSIPSGFSAEDLARNDPYQMEEWTSAVESESGNGSQLAAHRMTPPLVQSARRTLGFSRTPLLEPKQKFKQLSGNQHAKSRIIPLTRLGVKTNPKDKIRRYDRPRLPRRTIMTTVQMAHLPSKT